MKQSIRLTETELKVLIRESVIEALGDRWQNNTERIMDKRKEHSVSEYLKGKMDDIRHGLATMFGKEMSDDTYDTIVSGLTYQILGQIHADGSADPGLVARRDGIVNKYGKGYNRRNFGFYRDEDEVRPDTPEEIGKNAKNKRNMLQQRLQVAFQKMKQNVKDNDIQKYEAMSKQYNGQPNICKVIDGFEGYHGGSGSFFCTNSNGQPFFLYDYSTNGATWLHEIFSNDELYQYFPKTADEIK